VILVFVPAVWKIMVPPRVHFFLWLHSKNKLLTQDNLEKRRTVDDTICVFCTERNHLPPIFFDCVVAHKV
jgi:hypothetical protein